MGGYGDHVRHNVYKCVNLGEFGSTRLIVLYVIRSIFGRVPLLCALQPQHMWYSGDLFFADACWSVGGSFLFLLSFRGRNSRWHRWAKQEMWKCMSLSNGHKRVFGFWTCKAYIKMECRKPEICADISAMTGLRPLCVYVFARAIWNQSMHLRDKHVCYTVDMFVVCSEDLPVEQQTHTHTHSHHKSLFKIRAHMGRVS